ncbi:unnamed protein product [Symbiodinium natans]|uniref:Uncharacterized protein n=1 Tax=Symbiodinium natans TaxID=878477 RepID=A0A812HDG1_9DINO|nr:unnamed protein product [Symbiodinium natans]
MKEMAKHSPCKGEVKKEPPTSARKAKRRPDLKLTTPLKRKQLRRKLFDTPPLRVKKEEEMDEEEDNMEPGEEDSRGLTTPPRKARSGHDSGSDEDEDLWSGEFRANKRKKTGQAAKPRSIKKTRKAPCQSEHSSACTDTSPSWELTPNPTPNKRHKKQVEKVDAQRANFQPAWIDLIPMPSSLPLDWLVF